MGFDEAFKEFLQGAIDFGTFTESIEQSIASNPASAQHISDALDEVNRSGRLPAQVFQALKASIDSALQASQARAQDAAITGIGTGGDSQVSGVAPLPTQEQGESADKTRMAPPPRPSAPPGGESDGDKTHIVIPPREPPPADTTGGISPQSQTGSHTGAVTGRSATGSQTGTESVTGAGITGQTGRTDRSQSNWATTTGSWVGGEDREVGPGDTIKGRFLIESIVGQGGMGVVFKARDLRAEEADDRNPIVALKVLNKEFKQHPKSLQALQRETSRTRKLSHPNIVTVYDFDRDGGIVYMFMEFLDGAPLDKFIKSSERARLSIPEVIDMVLDMGAALAYAHRFNPKNPIVHSDFKPGNVFLTPGNKVKVFDFGIAQASTSGASGEGDKTLFDAGELGALTPAYASLEMIKGEEPDISDDVYALAIVTYELLTGKHPFNKIAADKALEKNLLPAPVKGLSRRQQRALRKGLSFSRSDRTETVEEFIDGIRIKKVNKTLAAASLAAVLLVGGGLAYYIPSYLEQTRLDDLAAKLMSDREEVVSLALIDLADETRSGKVEILTKEVRDNIFSYFRDFRQKNINAEAGLYQFPEVEKKIAQLTEIFPDSADLAEQASGVEDSKARLLNDLTTDFNKIVDQDNVLLEGDTDNIRQLLGIVAQIDPNHVLLGDQRIIRTYERAANQRMEEQRFEESLAVINSGLQLIDNNDLFDDKSALLNVRDRVQLELNRAAKEERIALLTEQLSVLQDATSLEVFRSELAALSELTDLAPKNELAIALSSSLSIAVVGELESRLDEKDWSASDALLDEFAPALDTAFVRDTRARVASARSAHEEKEQVLLATVVESANGGFQTEANEQAALRALDEIRQLTSSESVVSAAEDAILRSYIEAARNAMVSEQWVAAEAFVERGRSFTQSEAAQSKLQAQSKSIELAQAVSEGRLEKEQQQALEKERDSEIAKLVSRYDESLLKDPFTEKDLEASLDILDELSSMAPEHAIVSEAPGQLADRLAAVVTVYADQEDWSKASLVLSEYGARLPATTRLQAAKQQIAVGISAVEEDLVISRFDEQRQQLRDLLEAPEFTADWEGKLRTQLRAIEVSPLSNAEILAETNAAVADAYTKAINDRSSRQQFSEAQGLLDQAAEYVPTALLASIGEKLSKEEKEFEVEKEKEDRIAEIDGFKQTLLTQAGALDVKSAIDTLQKLESAAPEDSFIVLKARPEIAEAYAKLAGSAIDREKFAEAGAHIDAGLKFDQNNRKLNEQAQTIDQARQFADFKTDLMKQRASVGQLLEQWRKFSEQYPEQFTAFRGRLEQQLKEQIDSSSSDIAETAQWLVDVGNQLYGDGTFKLPAPPQEDSIAITVPPGPEDPATTPTTTTTTATATATTTTLPPPRLPGTHSRTCKDGLAGYGARGQGICYDFVDVAEEVRAPLMVVVPAGGGSSGAYAIGKYEISRDDYSLYCQQSGSCAPLSGNAGLPVTDISLDNMQAYTRWLSESTGYEYRIPTSDQWLHAAGGNKEVSLEGVNCRFKIGGKLMKGLALAEVKSGSANPWGVVNAIGNAQEVVLDGAAARLRGGAYTMELSDCGLETVASYDGSGGAETGFRVVRTIKGD